ncbi:hypothetical protein [Fructilactobacillus sanfranciscensis]|nr:hypothetical protein [Fructilactobacillus sanfranciscensis]
MEQEIYAHVNQCFDILGLTRSQIDEALEVINVVSDQLDNVDIHKITSVD